ncbi:MAG: uroporphyrinogen-III C-methyltransferase [Burkholderiales bacterium]
MKSDANGKVYLVGAGPGDPELLTLKAVRALGEADVILIDDLVNNAVLSHAREGTRIVQVGKRGGCPSTSQAFIERLMIKEALAGNVVVRLKGGDPFMFGRGGEEQATLMREGIDVEVAHGITSGIAAPARLGIAVTDRTASQGAIFVTGHGKDGSDPDWAALAKTGLTLVIYMGIARVAHIQQALIAGGLPPDTPAAAIQDACLPNERALTTSLANLANELHAHKIGSPAILVVGQVVANAHRRCDRMRRQREASAMAGAECRDPAALKVR